MATQLNATYGLSLSPILAHFQKIPNTPVLFLSMRLGAIARKYAHVHINNKTTVNKLWKLNKADIVQR